MDMNRRSLLKLTGASVAGAALLSVSAAATAKAPAAYRPGVLPTPSANSRMTNARLW